MYLFQLVLSLFLLVNYIIQINAVGVFELNLGSFRNIEGRLEDGTCCSDGSYAKQCTGPCKTFFRVCLKHFESKINLNSNCTFGEITTPVLGNNILDINRLNVPGFSNPIRIPFNFSWPGMFTLIVEGWHENYYSSSSSNPLNKKLITRYAAGRQLRVQLPLTEKYHRSNYTELNYSYRVVCDPFYYGDQCSTLCKPRNDTFGHFNCNQNGERECLPGWTGEFCTEAVCKQECSKQHGFCDQPDECKCKYGWTGSTCSQCERYPGCVNGECGQPWECKCKPGWGGLLCNQDLNYCSTYSPCKNNGVCSNSGLGGYVCNCPPGFIGKNCETEVSRCDFAPCKNNGVCKTLNALHNYTCVCPTGFHGKHCEIALTTCTSKPCRNGASCVDGPSGSLCVCTPGFHGELCESKQTDCSPNPCVNGGKCNLHLNSSYTCSCLPGFEGTHCETNVNDCSSNPCLNEGECLDGINKFTCRCKLGYIGDLCEINVDECKISPCANDGRCVDLVNDYKCICAPGFTGKDCSININECESSPCANDATCLDKVNEFQCICKPGFYGNLCELKSKYAETRSIHNKQVNLQPSIAQSVERPSAERLNSEQLIYISILSLIVPLFAFCIYIALRLTKKSSNTTRKHLKNNGKLTPNYTNGLPCKSIDEVEAMRQNEANINLLNNSTPLNNNSNKLNITPGANVIVNSLNRASSIYSLNKNKSTIKLKNNQLNNHLNSMSAATTTNENIYSQFPHYASKAHSIYASINENNRHSIYGLVNSATIKPVNQMSTNFPQNNQTIYSSNTLNSNQSRCKLYEPVYSQYNKQSALITVDYPKTVYGIPPEKRDNY